MASLLDVSRTTYLGWEKKTPPQAHVFRRISVILEMSMEELARGDEDFKIKGTNQQLNLVPKSDNPYVALERVGQDLLALHSAVQKIVEILTKEQRAKLGSLNETVHKGKLIAKNKPDRLN